MTLLDSQGSQNKKRDLRITRSAWPSSKFRNQKKTMDDNLAKFLGKAILKYRKQELRFVPKDYLVFGKSETTGWADGTEIRVATGKDPETWIGVFIHETCHVDQAIQKPQWMEDCEVSVGLLDEWLKGVRVNNMADHIRKIIELEHDCEKRAMAKIKANKLPFDLCNYAQGANAYILGYHWTLANRKWCTKTYKDHKVRSKMPSKLMPLNKLLNPSKQLLSVFDDQ